MDWTSFNLKRNSTSFMMSKDKELMKQKQNESILQERVYWWVQRDRCWKVKKKRFSYMRKNWVDDQFFLLVKDLQFATLVKSVLFEYDKDS